QDHDRERGQDQRAQDRAALAVLLYDLAPREHERLPHSRLSLMIARYASSSERVSAFRARTCAPESRSARRARVFDSAASSVVQRASVRPFAALVPSTVP